MLGSPARAVGSRAADGPDAGEAGFAYGSDLADGTDRAAASDLADGSDAAITAFAMGGSGRPIATIAATGNGRAIVAGDDGRVAAAIADGARLSA
ncbi:MAG TPA: hypothetical protein VG756_11385 [Pseudonocardiaceae bacterium]|nr:hypothetical protein [Pseudonocardiaceae bacterium]